MSNLNLKNHIVVLDVTQNRTYCEKSCCQINYLDWFQRWISFLLDYFS